MRFERSSTNKIHIELSHLPIYYVKFRLTGGIRLHGRLCSESFTADGKTIVYLAFMATGAGYFY